MKKPLSRFISVFVFVFNGAFTVFSQTPPVEKLAFEIITIKDGLSQGMVSSIIRDRQGCMWFATKDGLNKYDGYKITAYRHDPKNSYSLGDNYVTSLLEDSSGNLWIP